MNTVLGLLIALLMGFWVLYPLHYPEPYWLHFQSISTLAIECSIAFAVACPINYWDRIHNTTFSSWLTNRPNKLERYITLCQKDFPITNSLAYWSNAVLFRCLHKLRHRAQLPLHPQFSSLASVSAGPDVINVTLSRQWRRDKLS